jgi:hypothetical protein
MNYVIITELFVTLMSLAMTLIGLTEFGGIQVAGFLGWVIMFIVLYLLLIIDTATMFKYASDKSATTGTTVQQEGVSSGTVGVWAAYYSNPTLFRFNAFAWLWTLFFSIAVFCFFAQTGHSTLDLSETVIINTVGQMRPYLQWMIISAAMSFTFPVLGTFFIESAYAAGQHQKGS